MEAELKDWFAHNHAANSSIIELLLGAEARPPKALEIFSHLLNAHGIWLSRINPVEQHQLHPWEPVEISRFSTLNDQNYSNTLLYLQSAAFGSQAERRISYQNTKGANFTNTLLEIYFHILTHSAYHRGQMALLLRQNDLAPPLTDYIFYKRDMPPISG